MKLAPSESLDNGCLACRVVLEDPTNQGFRRFIPEDQTVRRTIDQRKEVSGETLDRRFRPTESGSEFSQGYWRWQQRKACQQRIDFSLRQPSGERFSRRVFDSS